MKKVIILSGILITIIISLVIIILLNNGTFFRNDQLDKNTNNKKELDGKSKNDNNNNSNNVDNKETDNNKVDDQNKVNNDDNSNKVIDDNTNNNNNTNNSTNTIDSKALLAKLNNINERIDFFDMSKLEEYVSYKEKYKNLSDEMVVVYVNIGLNRAFYTGIKPTKNPTSLLVLVNKYNSLSSSYVPSDLEVINKSYASGTQQLRREARGAFEKLASEAKAKGYNIYAVSTYRSYSYQSTLYNNYAAKDGIANADTYSARPGHSEHQTGLAVDVANSSMTIANFGGSKEHTWMKENSYRYGFILRYTTSNEWIVGYLNEPWHYRYVGEEIATYMYHNQMTYEEYYVRFLDK